MKGMLWNCRLSLPSEAGPALCAPTVADPARTIRRLVEAGLICHRSVGARAHSCRLSVVRFRNVLPSPVAAYLVPMEVSHLDHSDAPVRLVDAVVGRRFSADLLNGRRARLFEHFVFHLMKSRHCHSRSRPMVTPSPGQQAVRRPRPRPHCR